MSLKRRSVSSNNNSNTSSVVSDNLINGQEYEGRLVYVADLGLQERSHEGKQKDPAQQIALGIEIIGETVEFEDGTTKPKILWSYPFYIYNAMSTNGKELVYYKVFEPTAVPDTVAEWDKQLNKPCSVTIKHGFKNENVYDNIGNLASIPKKYHDSIEEAVTEPCVGDADDIENEATKALYGLVRYVYGRRLNEAAYEKLSEADYDDSPQIDQYNDDGIPF